MTWEGWGTFGLRDQRRPTRPTMRATKVLSNILGMKQVRARGFVFDDEGLTIEVQPTTNLARCSGCGCRARRIYDHHRGRKWRHPDFAGMKVTLRYDLRRVDCSRCGVRVELVPWADPESGFTRAFEDQVAYLAQHTDKTTVVGMMQLLGPLWAASLRESCSG
jgi:transposase